MSTPQSTQKPFPIPVSTIGPGSQPEEEETLEYLAMPQGMETFHPPILPEPEDLAAHAGVMSALQDILTALQSVAEGANPKRETKSVSLTGMTQADFKLLSQVLGEGEVSAQIVEPEGRISTKIQESVFAGIWRVIQTLPDGRVLDCVEVGAVPEILRQAATADTALGAPPVLPTPPQVHNAPSILVELEDARKRWREGDFAHVVNLTLLPLTAEDIGYMDMRLGTGRVLILSRGYGNCRITNCSVLHTWRVVYYNSSDTVILNSVEVTTMPEVACAAPEDLSDSLVRFTDVIKWVSQSE